MRVGLITVAYHEPRFIVPFLKHVPDWVERKLVLNSLSPWFGAPEPFDPTATMAEPYAEVIQSDWPTEESQRNTGLDLLSDMGWVIVLDPDEFLDNKNWEDLRVFLDLNTGDAFTCAHQHTYWKNGYVARPAESHRQIIAVRPHIRFIDKRTVNTTHRQAPIEVHHFSWARTDEEVWRKISHYAHAQDFNIDHWFNNVWKRWRTSYHNVHPTNPSSLKRFVRAELPKEIEELNLWP